MHIVHAIANGGIEDEQQEKQRVGDKMIAEAVRRTYSLIECAGG